MVDTDLTGVGAPKMNGPSYSGKMRELLLGETALMIGEGQVQDYVGFSESG